MEHDPGRRKHDFTGPLLPLPAMKQTNDSDKREVEHEEEASGEVIIKRAAVTLCGSEIVDGYLARFRSVEAPGYTEEEALEELLRTLARMKPQEALK